MLDSAQMHAVYCLALGKSYQETADEIDISKQTIVNWRKKEEFNEELKKVIKTTFDDLAVTAKETLLYLMTDKNVNSTVKFKACQEVLNRIDYLQYIDKNTTNNAPQDILITID